MNEIEQRFGGTARLYGQQALNQLTQGHICVVGIGGVGSWAAEALARTAVGHLTLIDLDDICITNTNRQIHAVDGQIGQLKVNAMADRIKKINPLCKVNPVTDFVTKDNLEALIGGQFHVVIDAIDSVHPKAALLNYCIRHKIKAVTIGGAGGQIDPLQITSADLSKTSHDPLAKKVRNILNKDYGFGKSTKNKFGVECIYSTEQLKYPQPDGTVCNAKSTMNGSTRLDCASGFGAATMVTASFGFAAAAKAVDILLKLKSV